MRPPIHQRAIKWLFFSAACMAAGFFFLGSFFDAITNSLSLVTTVVTYVGTGVAVIGLVGANIYLKRHPLPWVVKDKEIRITRVGRTPFWITVGILVFLWVPYIHTFMVEPELLSGNSTGFLTPANDSDPVYNCEEEIPGDAMLVFLGNSVAYSENDDYDIIHLQKEVALGVKNTLSGLLVNATLRDKTGRGTLFIENNKFVMNGNAIWYGKKPDAHTLEVYDEFGKKSFYLRYLNSHAIKVIGTFYASDPSIRPYIIEEDNQVLGGLHASGDCIGGLSFISGSFLVDLSNVNMLLNNTNANAVGNSSLPKPSPEFLGR